MHHWHVHRFFFIFSFSIPFRVVYSLLVHSLIYILLILLVHLLGNVEDPATKASEMIERKQEERRAKVACTHVIADGKFRPSGISGERSRV